MQRDIYTRQRQSQRQDQELEALQKSVDAGCGGRARTKSQCQKFRQELETELATEPKLMLDEKAEPESELKLLLELEAEPESRINARG